MSSTVSPEIGEYERTSTCVANAYVQPIFKKYVNLLAKGIKKIGIENDLFLMLSDGGIVHEKIAVEYPIRLVQSGPAGGAQAATLYGKIQKISDILCFDMGGTTAKACLIENGKWQFVDGKKGDFWFPSICPLLIVVCRKCQLVDGTYYPFDGKCQLNAGNCLLADARIF